MTWQIVLALVTAAGGTSPAVGRAPRTVDERVVTLRCRPVAQQSAADANQLACTVDGEAGVRMTATRVTQVNNHVAELVDPFRPSVKPKPAPSDPDALVDPFEPTTKRAR